MLNHVVIFTWRDGVTAEQAASFGAALTKLGTDLATPIQHGADLGFRDTNGDYALIAQFADRAAWDTYQAHPDHTAFLQDHAAALVASRVAIQF